MPPENERQSRKFPAPWLLPPALLPRDDHRPTNPILLGEPEAAIAPGIGAGLEPARPDDDVRTARALRGEFLRTARALRVGLNAGKKRGGNDCNGQKAAVFRHHHHPTVNGCPFPPFRQLAPELVSQRPAAV